MVTPMRIDKQIRNRDTLAKNRERKTLMFGSNLLERELGVACRTGEAVDTPGFIQS